MLKINCPRCHCGLRVPQQKIPLAGGWAACPKCRERFFINLSSQSFLNSEAPRQPAGAPNQYQARQQRTETVQKLINKLREKNKFSLNTTPSGTAFSENEIIVVLDERSKFPLFFYYLGIWLCVCLPLVCVFFFFDAKPDQPAQQAEADSVGFVNNEASVSLIRSDLLYIKKKYASKSKFKTLIDTKGSESRVYKYFMGKLAPGGCNKILSLEMSSKNPARGFTATAICEPGMGDNLVMDLEWINRNALVTFVGAIGQEEFEVFVITPMKLPAE